MTAMVTSNQYNSFYFNTLGSSDLTCHVSRRDVTLVTLISSAIRMTVYLRWCSLPGQVLCTTSGHLQLGLLYTRQRASPSPCSWRDGARRTLGNSYLPLQCTREPLPRATRVHCNYQIEAKMSSITLRQRHSNHPASSHFRTSLIDMRCCCV